MRTFKQGKKKDSVLVKIKSELLKRGIISKRTIVKHKVVPANKLFNEFVKTFRSTFTLGIITGNVEPIQSVVNGRECIVTESTSFIIWIMNSWLRVTPNKSGGLCVSRLQVETAMRGNGIGTMLMETFLKVLKDSFINIYNTGNNFEIPTIDLEILDNVGFGKNHTLIDVEDTANFYSSFGFEVVESYENYRRMELDIVKAIKKSDEFESSLVDLLSDEVPLDLDEVVVSDDFDLDNI